MSEIAGHELVAEGLSQSEVAGLADGFGQRLGDHVLINALLGGIHAFALAQHGAGAFVEKLPEKHGLKMLCHLTNFIGFGQLIVLRELFHREVVLAHR